jgi:hypothetical protein
MADYPNNYKFTSVSIEASYHKKVYQRLTYDLLQTFGDVGGINEFFRVALGFLISGFAAVT